VKTDVGASCDVPAKPIAFHRRTKIHPGHLRQAPGWRPGAASISARAVADLRQAASFDISRHERPRAGIGLVFCRTEQV